ncbi:MAG: diguanylate cyclase, partial [Pseudomonas aeruginosa]|nr:diguanylate cyclase [Pseudomonas aeruginosa]
MAPPKQSNTIDFDAAKQKRGPQPGGNASGPRASNLTELRQQLTLQLQSSLEAERILGLFFEEVRQLIPLDALGYRHPGSDLRLEFGSSAKHSVSYRLSHDSDYLGELIFRRRQRLGEDEQRQLESLLGTLLFPLRNALLYRAAIQTALRDALTGTGNRIAMDQALGRELELARRNLQPLSVLMLDIDHFK